MLDDLIPPTPVARQILTVICEDLGYGVDLKHGGRNSLHTMLSGKNYLAHIRASDQTQKLIIASIPYGKKPFDSMHLQAQILYGDPDLFQEARRAIVEVLKAPAGKYPG
jgi:hypothetical protein